MNMVDLSYRFRGKEIPADRAEVERSEEAS
jgi:hypothetical protein